MWVDPSGYVSKDVIGDDSDVLELSTRFLNHNDQLWKNADNIKPIEGYQDIVVHGDKRSFAYINADGVEIDVSVEDFANVLKESPVYDGGAIRLISCETGAPDATTAREFADIMGVDVLAPSDTVYVYPDGEMFIGKNRNGYWSIFKPGGN